MHKLAFIFITIGWIVVAYYIATLIKKSSQKHKIRLRDKQLKEAFNKFWLHLSSYDYVFDLKLDYDTQYRQYYYSVVELKNNNYDYLEKLLIELHWKSFRKTRNDMFFIMINTTKEIEYKKYISLDINNAALYLTILTKKHDEIKVKIFNTYKPYYDNFPKDFFGLIGINKTEFLLMFIKWYHKAGEDKVAEFFKTFTDKYEYAKQTQNNHQNKHQEKQQHNHQNNGSRNHKTSVVNPYEILQVSQTASKKEIRLAFLKLSKRYHPDAGFEATTEKFIALKAAYDKLMK